MLLKTEGTSNDEDTKRAYKRDSDAYRTFRRMLKNALSDGAATPHTLY
jgi:hypothetical protein